MDDQEQEKLVAEANVVGVTMRRLSDANRELEATNASLQDALRRADDEIARKDATIANQAAQLDGMMRDSDLAHKTVLEISARSREYLAQKKQPVVPMTGAPTKASPSVVLFGDHSKAQG